MYHILFKILSLPSRYNQSVKSCVNLNRTSLPSNQHYVFISFYARLLTSLPRLFIIQNKKEWSWFCLSVIFPTLFCAKYFSNTTQLSCWLWLKNKIESPTFEKRTKCLCLFTFFPQFPLFTWLWRNQAKFAQFWRTFKAV